MSNLSTLPKGDSAWLLRKAIQRIIQQVSVLETNIGSSTTGNSNSGEVIFNDAGVLRGDSGLTFNSTTDTLRAGLLIVPGNTQLATVGILYVGSLGSPKLKVDVAGTGETTIASATVTGDLTVDTSTLKVDSANNRVGILTASPRSGFALDVLGSAALGDSTTSGASRLTLDGSGTVGNVPMMRLRSAGVQKAFFGLSGGFIGDTSTDAIIATDAAGAAIRFYTSDNGIEVARFNSTGNLAFANTKGIDFSATSSGSGTMTSELLNDYEEGTWTATLKGSVSDPTTPVTATGRYTKIGRVVTVAVNFSGVNTTGASGDVSVIDLPFACGLVACIGSAGIGASLAYSGTLTSVVDASGTTVFLVSQISSSYASLATHVAGTNKNLAISITYTV